MNAAIFGCYDIRGRIPDDFSIADGATIAHAILQYYRQQEPKLNAICLGRDGRTTSDGLAEHVHTAAAKFGIIIHDLGLCASPQLYHALHTGPVTSGIMITASHNGPEYNGFKLRLNKRPVWGDELQAIGKNAALLCSSKATKSPLPSSPISSSTIRLMVEDAPIPHSLDTVAASTSNKGMSFPAAKHNVQSVIGNPGNTLSPTEHPYLTDLTSRFAHLNNSPINAIIDASNGAAGPAIEKLITALQLANVTLLNTMPDGRFPNHPPDPSKAVNLIDLITQVQNANTPTIGLALDGDGDRLTIILEDGTHLSGDDALALLAQPVLEKNPGAQVVCDIKSSSRLTKTVATAGGTCHFAPCGHTYIQAAMRKHGALLGGEVSGHLFFNDEYFGFDDGIYALLRVLDLRHQTDTPLVNLFAQLPAAYAIPEQRIACKNKHEIVVAFIKKVKMWQRAKLTTIDGVRVEFANGWLLVRAAQTEPAISIRCEGESEAELKSIFKSIHKAIQTLEMMAP